MSLVVSTVVQAARAVEPYALAGPFSQILTEGQIGDIADGTLALSGTATEFWSAPPDLKQATFTSWVEDSPLGRSRVVSTISQNPLTNSDNGSGELLLSGSASESNQTLSSAHGTRRGQLVFVPRVDRTLTDT